MHPHKGKQQQAFVGVQARHAWRCVRFGNVTFRPSRQALCCQAASSHGGQPDRANVPKHNAQANQAMESLTATSKIGSEYGEVITDNS